MSVRRGLFYSFAQTGGQFFIQFFSAIIIARLLPPSELGVVAVALAAITILDALREFGVQRYVIKEPDLTEDKIRTVFGVALLVSWSMAALVFLSRQMIADFYGEPRLAAIFAVLSFCFVVLPIGLPAGGLLRRERRYKELSVIVLLATASNTILSITLALMGFGPISLAWGSVAQATVLVAAILYFKPDHLRLRPSLKEWRAIGSFGGLASLDAFIATLGGQLPQILMGKSLAFADVGYYVRSQRLATMVHRLFQSSVSWVTDTELGEKHRAGETMQPMLLKATSFTVVIAWPALIFMAIEADRIIELLFGQAWAGAAPILQALCVAQAALIAAGQASSVYMATGDIKLKLRNEMLAQSIGLALLMIGLMHSVLMVAWLRVVFGLAFLVVHMTAIRKYTGITYGMLLQTLATPALLTAAFGTILLLIQQALPASLNDNPLSLFPKAAIMAVVYLVLLVLLRHPLVDELKSLLRRWRRAA